MGAAGTLSCVPAALFVVLHIRKTDDIAYLCTMTTDQFVAEHREGDVRQLAFLASRYPDVDMPYALDQIAGWQTARRKLPSWAACPGIVYPPHLSMEQCSSEATARYKAAVVSRLVAGAAHPTVMADFTGGFGVDFSFLSRGFDSAFYIEHSERLAATTTGNLQALGINHATTLTGEAEDILPTLPHLTLAYLDPARRNGHGGRTVAIADCTPDVCALWPELSAKADRIVLKLSPMLDWHKAVADLGDSICEVHAVAVAGECKELLLVADLTAPTTDRPLLHCIDIRPDRTLTFTCRDTDNTIVPVASETDIRPGARLYEPGAPIMKIGCFAALAERYGLRTVAPNSHLFVGSEGDGVCNEGTNDGEDVCDEGILDGGNASNGSGAVDFPGRRFIIDRVSTMNKKELRTALSGITKANIAVRNFPMTADALRRKLRLADGGDTYLFATTDAAGRHVIVVGHKEI